MNIFIDCEWNDFDNETFLAGDLISMALVSDCGKEFYEVLECENPTEWVNANVIPILDKEPIERTIFTQKLYSFLNEIGPFTLIADWPEDIAKFCNMLIDGPGHRINTPDFEMKIVRLDAPSQIPHNALADARGLQETYINNKYES